MDLHLDTIKDLQEMANPIYASFGEGFKLMKVISVTGNQVDIELVDGQPAGRITLYYTQLVIAFQQP
ncbi:MAG: hypothetical protein ACKVI8_00350 [Paraglaciecola sp.]